MHCVNIKIIIILTNTAVKETSLFVSLVRIPRGNHLYSLNNYQ